MSRACVEASETAMVHRRVEACPDPAAAWALCEFMGDISQRCYRAGWMCSAGNDLWAILQGERERMWGMYEVTHAEMTILRMLSKSCAGWWTWPDEMETQPVFVTLDEWKEIREKREKEPK
jgi:hypothetical protein